MSELIDRRYRKYQQWKEIFFSRTEKGNVLVIGFDDFVAKQLKIDFPLVNFYFVNISDIQSLKTIENELAIQGNHFFSKIIPNRPLWGLADSSEYQMTEQLFRSLLGPNIKEVGSKVKSLSGQEALLWSILEDLVV